ncbi:hypothetical protein RES5_011635 (plasmid) [Staphylococcus haemolyticus]|uniref:hypothetical protein n=1 Tax=Staphylococcus haemolyticus TaxID=1283 RepID=UPI001374AD7D|nr:hypothetical protein [Staphylococcus haemolyticus]QUX20062.1 hypothetical protein RES7_011515 [Staphylococcus haemolyticus]UCI01044.1 hypothetical protein RES5_011635 [Staphylococcus haemolyticus]UCI03253.1 hypothetical protein RES6_011630 [Staphylococcus haemolyticus]
MKNNKLIDSSIKELSNHDMEELFVGSEVELRGTPVGAAAAQAIRMSSARCLKAVGIGGGTGGTVGIVTYTKNCLG